MNGTLASAAAMELQQSPRYRQYVAALGWTVTEVDGIWVFWRRLPLVGAIAKIQRPSHLPYLPALALFLKTNGITRIAIEPRSSEDAAGFTRYMRSLTRFCSPYTTHFLPTKTIRVNLAGSEEAMFGRLSQAKRRAVRRAEKYGVRIAESRDVACLIAVKNRSAGMFGNITTYGADTLWHALGANHTAALIASADVAPLPFVRPKPTTVGGVFLVLWGDTAYYWIAGATRDGKKRFAPTALVWACMRLAKRRGAAWLDFLGVWDERLPKENASWKGFTKFKEGFGGETILYPLFP